MVCRLFKCLFGSTFTLKYLFFNILLALTDHVFFVSMSTELQIIYQIQDRIHVKIMCT